MKALAIIDQLLSEKKSHLEEHREKSEKAPTYDMMHFHNKAITRLTEEISTLEKLRETFLVLVEGTK